MGLETEVIHCLETKAAPGSWWTWCVTESRTWVAMEEVTRFICYSSVPQPVAPDARLGALWTLEQNSSTAYTKLS
jgi:hypothetical protein